MGPERTASAARRRPLTIVHVVGPVAAGGMERVVEFLSTGHHRRGHQVTVATVLSSDHDARPFLDAVAAGGVSTHRVQVKPRGYLKEIRRVRELLCALSPDVVHTHGYRRNLLHRPTAARLGIPTVTTLHGRDTRGIKGTIYEWLQTVNLRRFDAVVAVSRALYEQMRGAGVPSDRLHLIPNAWGGSADALPREVARQKLDLPLDANIVGWVGRLVPVKGADVFLEALGRLPDPRPIAVMIGYGPQEGYLRELSKQLGLESVVRFHTRISDAGLHFRAFDTYVLSSRSEGLPIVLLEAMAAETPIVATRVGGVPEAIEEDEAWLVPPEDPLRLAEAIAESLRDPATAHDRARRAALRLKHDYALDSFLASYEDMYFELLDRKERLCSR